MTTNSNSTNIEVSRPEIVPQMSLRDFFLDVLSHWQWFVLSVGVCLCVAFYVYLTSVPQFTVNAQIHIKEDTRRPQSIGQELGDLGLMTSTSNVDNEFVVFQSPALALQVARRLHLDFNYYRKGTLRRIPLYGSTLPVCVSIEDIEDVRSASFKVTIDEAGKLFLSDFVFRGETFDERVAVEFDVPSQTPVGKVTVFKSYPYDDLIKAGEKYEIFVHRNPMSIAGAICGSKLAVMLNGKLNSIIDLSYIDDSSEKATDILNCFINEYNKNWIADKNAMAEATSRFIDERLRIIESELGHVEENISSYMSDNLVVADQQTATVQYLQQSNASDQQIMLLNTQLYLCNQVRAVLLSGTESNELLPANTGINAPEIESMIVQYNQKQLQRNMLAQNSSEQHPVVVNLNSELRELQSNIIKSLDAQIRAVQAQLSSVEKKASLTRNRMSDSPLQQKQLRGMNRQQSIKEMLYVFLLQKREETELSQAFTAYNTRIVTPPMGLLIPTSPVKTRIFGLALLIGFLFPLIVLYIMELSATKVRGRCDLEGLQVPLLGELPDLNRRSSLYGRLWDQRKKSNRKIEIKVLEGNRDIINEAFRILRANLNFMLRVKSAVGDGTVQPLPKVILITSAHAGAGKSFISVNLAQTFGLSQKRVAVLDLDLRRSTISQLVGKPRRGIVDYISGIEDDWHSLLQHVESIDIMPRGIVPPNPSELLQSPRLQQLLEAMRQEYDLIFLDMPPAEIVADVTIVQEYTDLVLYVLRAGMTELDILPVIDQYYAQNRYRMLAVLLNGVELSHHRYGYGHYGYSYGSYGRSYNYNYE